MAVWDKVFRLDPKTKLYTGYMEVSEGAILIAPEKFMERRYDDVLPISVAESVDYGAHVTRETGAPHIFGCCLFGVWHRVSVQALCGSIFLNSSIRQAFLLILTTVLEF